MAKIQSTLWINVFVKFLGWIVVSWKGAEGFGMEATTKMMYIFVKKKKKKGPRGAGAPFGPNLGLPLPVVELLDCCYANQPILICLSM